MTFGAETSSYRSVPSEDDFEEAKDEVHGSSRSWPVKKTFSSRFLIFSHLLTSSIYIVIIYIAYHQSSFLDLEACSRGLSTWSPALSAIAYNPPAFFSAQINQTNEYRGANGERPPAEVDEAWDGVGIGVPGIRLSAEEIQGLGKNLKEGTKAVHEIQDGKGGYVAMLEVFHMLHCLDELRKALFYNWDYYQDTYGNASVNDVQMHHDHCVDAIRLSLMCTADVTPVTFVDDSAIPMRRTSLPDFSTRHTCRDFDAILNWNWETERAVMWEDVGDAVTWDSTLGEAKGHSHGDHKHEE